MTQQTSYDPLTLYEGAVQWTGSKMNGVQLHHLTSPTPCTEWNVQALMNHLVDGAARAAAAFSGAEPAARSGDGTAENYAASTAKALEQAKAPGAIDRTVKGFRGDVPARDFLTGSFMDTLTHGWDMAVATGQDPMMSAHLAEACYAIYKPRVETFRGGTAFAAEVEVPEGASTQAKLLAILGRKA